MRLLEAQLAEAERKEDDVREKLEALNRTADSLAEALEEREEADCVKYFNALMSDIDAALDALPKKEG